MNYQSHDPQDSSLPSLSTLVHDQPHFPALSSRPDLLDTSGPAYVDATAVLLDVIHRVWSHVIRNFVQSLSEYLQILAHGRDARCSGSCQLPREGLCWRVG